MVKQAFRYESHHSEGSTNQSQEVKALLIPETHHLMFPAELNQWSPFLLWWDSFWGPPALIIGEIPVIKESRQDHDTGHFIQQLELQMSQMTAEAKNEVILEGFFFFNENFSSWHFYS